MNAIRWFGTIVIAAWVYVAIPLHAATIVTYQDGDGGAYSDTDDTWFNEGAPDAPGGASDSLRIRSFTGNDRSSLIAFRDIIGADVVGGQIPSGSSIVSATLYVREKIAGSMNGDGQAATLLRDWVEGTGDGFTEITASGEFGATWNNASAFFTGEGTDVAWETAGAQGITDRGSVVDASASNVTYNAQTDWWSWDVTTAVQSWADGDANLGLILFGTGGGINGQAFSSNTGTVSNRPVLEVTFIPEPGSFALLGLGAVLILVRRK